jgi:hypothetical protein
MIMKKFMMTMIAALCMSSAFAFNQGPKTLTPAEKTDMMAKELNLTKKQQTKVLALNEKYADLFQRPAHHGRHHMKDGKCPKQQMEGCKKDVEKKECCKKDAAEKKECCKKEAGEKKDCCKKKMGGKREITPEQKAKMEQMHQKREAYDKELESILTKKQFQQYQENKAKHHGRHGHHGKPHGKPAE